MPTFPLSSSIPNTVRFRQLKIGELFSLGDSVWVKTADGRGRQKNAVREFYPDKLVFAVEIEKVLNRIPALFGG